MKQLFDDLRGKMFKKSKNSTFFTVLILCLAVGMIGSCASVKSKPPRFENMPDIFPLHDFLLSKDSNYSYKVSPNGKMLAWLAVKDKRITIFFKTIGQPDIGIIDTHSKRQIYGISWLPDSRRMLYHQDQFGNENHHLFLVDTNKPAQKPIDLTPLENTRVRLHRIIRSDPDQILVEHNNRDKHVFDLYKIDLKTRQQIMVAQNPGDTFSWITNREGQLKARFRRVEKVTENNYYTFQILLDKGTWKTIVTGGLEDNMSVLDFTVDNKEVWLLSNKRRDRLGLVRLNLQTGEETLVFEDPKVDVGRVWFSYKTRKPIAAFSFPNYPKLHFFDKKAESEVNSLNLGQSALSITSLDYEERIVTLSVYTDKSIQYFLFNRQTGVKTKIGEHPINQHAEFLSDIKPIEFKSRDGLTIHGYLTIPHGTSGKDLPMVLLVHGGPWHRDYWGYSGMVQFLANRGYVVLQVNYRGSTGYGRAFKEAAVGEFAGKMHTDLIDGVQWVLDQGIADPQKIGIFGGSYGGYSTLVGLTFTPEVFACGVDLVGMSNLVSLLESVPLYWKNYMHYWYKYVGNPDIPSDRKIMKDKSPLFRVDQVQRPLFIAQGGNDPRVNQKESDQMVAALKKAGKEVEYLLCPDEGHGFRYWKNRLRFYRQMENFLEKHLAGRNGGFDYYELGL